MDKGARPSQAGMPRELDGCFVLAYTVQTPMLGEDPLLA